MSSVALKFDSFPLPLRFPEFGLVLTHVVGPHMTLRPLSAAQDSARTGPRHESGTDASELNRFFLIFI